MSMRPPTSAAAQRVQEILARRGFANQVVEFAQTTRSAAEAAAAVGCAVAQIAKTIVFRGGDERAVIVIASGANRVDEKKVAAALDVALRKADAEFVRAETGYVIGGVSPAGLPAHCRVLIDRDLAAFSAIWAAAGAPNAVFPLTPDQLLRLCGGALADVKLDPLET
jgi:Cys-tRNA(Pro) deacylase